MADTRERALARRAEEQHGVFTMQQVREHGLPGDWRRNRLADGRIVLVRDLAYRFAGTPLDWRGELLAAVWAGGPRGRASHRSAAALLGLTGGRTDLVEVTCPRWKRARHEDLVIHETKAFHPVDTATVDGVPCTTCARTLLDLGAVLSSNQVEYALDHALRKRLVTVVELERVLRRVGRRGRDGVGVLRAILEAHTPGKAAESPPERRMVRMLMACGLPRPVLQHEIRHRGAFVARVDAAYPQWRIAVEYDSYEYHDGDLAITRDNDRRNLLRRVGWEQVAVRKANLARGCIDTAATIRAIREDFLTRSGVTSA